MPVNTFRMWDTGLRAIPCGVIERVTVSLTEHLDTAITGHVAADRFTVLRRSGIVWAG